MLADPSGTMHETCIAQLFLHNSLLGECSFDAAEAQDLSWRWSSAALFCPFCGEVWGRIILLREQGCLTFQSFRVSCEKHPDQWNVPGSFLEPWHDSLIPYLPKRVLERELQLLLRQMEIPDETDIQSPTAGAGVNPSNPASPS